MFKFVLITFSAFVFGFASPLQVLAQTVPTAGVASGSTSDVPPRTDMRPVQKNELPLAFSIETSSTKIKVEAIRFVGNSAMSDAQLQSLMADAKGQSFDVAGLEALAARVANAYRLKGFSVARAYVPAQQSLDGSIEIAVIEGRYGDLVLKQASTLSPALVQGIFNANGCDGASECKGRLIKDLPSDRVLLLLRDMPGISAQATLQAGKAVGTSDYVVDVQTVRPSSFSAGYDNYGDPSVGKNRLNYSVIVNNLNGNGEQLSFDVASMGVKQVTGGAAYSIPVGYFGTRAGVGYAHSVSRVGGAFVALGAIVVGDSLSVYALHPVIRGVNESLYVRAAAEISSGTITKNSGIFGSNATTSRFALSGDKIDRYGGYTAYGLGVASGHYASAYDSSDGHFSKIPYKVSRQQSLVGSLTLYGSLSGQTANMVLPSGEMIGVGGPNSVRAYAAGEGGNSVGGVGTLELRYSQVLALAGVAGRASLLTYSIFADRGWSDSHRGGNAVASARAIGGFGLGIGLSSQAYYLRSSWARHGMSDMNISQIDPTAKGQFWLQAGIHF